MSKRKKYNKHIIKGFFYHIHEGSPTGHPGMIIWKSDKKNLYLALTTDSSIGQHRTRLSAPTSTNVRHSFVYHNVKEDPHTDFVDGYLYRWGMNLTKNNTKNYRYCY